MKRILPLLTTLFSLLSMSANAQWNPITHTSGTQSIAGVGVTVTNSNGITGGGCGGLYWIQQTNASYTFTFAPAVDAIMITADALNTGESIEFIINGQTFPITNCNLVPTPYVNNCSVGNCNIVNGQFVNNTAFWVCGGVMVYYGPITSFTILEPIGGSGTTFNIEFVVAGGVVPPMGTSASYVVAGSNGPLCEGSTLNLTASNTYEPYSWTGPNGFTSNQQNPTISNTTPAMSGDYIVTSITDCDTLIDTVTVVIDALPTVPVISSNSPVCQNYPINLTATNVVAGTNPTWTGPNGFSSNQQNPVIPSAQLVHEGTYTITVTSGVCPPQSSNIFVDVKPTPLAPVTSPVSFCQHSPAPALTATGQNLRWYTTATGGTGVPSLTPPNNVAGVLNYWVSQTVDGCESPRTQLNVTVKPQPQPPLYTGPVHYCAGDPAVPLTVSGTNLQWYDDQNVLLAGAPTPVTTTPADFTWFVTQTVDACVSEQTTINIHVAAIPPPPVVENVIQCQHDEPKALTAVGQDLKWYNDATGGSALANTPVPETDDPTIRTWYVSQTIDGCESPRAPLEVTIRFLPTSTFDASRPLVCENDTLSFWYTGNAGLSEIYTWTLPADSAELVSGAEDTPGPLVIRFDSVGSFPLTLNVNNQGCNTSTTYMVKVLDIPVVTISMPNDVCVHDSVKVGLGDYNSYIASLTWSFGGGVNVRNNINEGPYLIQWNNTGLRRVQVIASNTACETTSFDTVRVHAVPDAHFTALTDGSQLCIGDSVRLAAVDNNPLYSYDWAPARFFNHSNNFAPVVNAYVAAAQAITLTVTSPYGCAATLSTMMDADACCVVSMPNVFTPNGDGKNDIFRPITVGSHSMKVFMIVNRWGQKVFETVDENQGWDGSMNGTDQDMGTYFYVLQYVCNGKKQEQKGEVILLR